MINLVDLKGFGRFFLGCEDIIAIIVPLYERLEPGPFPFPKARTEGERVRQWILATLGKGSRSARPKNDRLRPGIPGRGRQVSRHPKWMLIPLKSSKEQTPESVGAPDSRISNLESRLLFFRLDIENETALNGSRSEWLPERISIRA